MKARNHKRLATMWAVVLLAFPFLFFSGRPAASMAEYIVLFDRDQAMPNEAGMKAVTQIIQAVRGVVSRGDKQIAISLIGYADRSGPETSNMQLSRRRAESVRDILRSAGMNDESIYIIYVAWRGESEPESLLPSEDWKDRRVRVVIQNLD